MEMISRTSVHSIEVDMPTVNPVKPSVTEKKEDDLDVRCNSKW